MKIKLTAKLRRVYVLGVHPWGAQYGHPVAQCFTIKECWRVARFMKLFDEGEPYITTPVHCRFLWMKQRGGYKSNRTSRLLCPKGEGK